MRLHLVGTALLLIGVGFHGSGLAAQAVIAGPASVQTTTDQVQRQLRSDDPAEIAWGAFLAAQNRLKSAVPLLQERLASRPANDFLPTELAILDALVQLDATLPAQAVRSSLDRCPVQALILLANASSGRDEMLLSLLESTSGFRWQAAANVLLMTKPPGFARRLLTGLRMRLVIDVDDQQGRGFGGSVGGVSDGANVAHLAPGFPPLADYQFAPAMPGATILTLGPHAVYYVRRIRGPGVYEPHVYADSPSSMNVDRVQYLNTLATDKSDAGPLYEMTGPTVLWTNTEGLRRQVVEQRRRVEDAYRLTISLLVTRGYLTADEARPLRPEIHVTLSDQRHNRSEPLPAIEGTAPPTPSPRPQP